MTCEHEPWIDLESGKPRTIGFFTTAEICKKCGAVYVSPGRQARIDDRMAQPDRPGGPARFARPVLDGEVGPELGPDTPEDMAREFGPWPDEEPES